MSQHARAWQEVRRSARGLQRFSCVELELARTFAGVPRLEYVPLAPANRTVHLARFAEFSSHFGRQAPAPRSVLAIARGRRPERFAERYRDLSPPEHDGSTILSADVAEIAVVSEGVRRGHVSVDTKRPRAAESAPPILQRVLELTWREERMLFCPAGKDDFRSPEKPADRIDFVVGVGPQGAVMCECVPDLAAACVFNAGYFQWLDDDTQDPYSCAFDPVGLVIAGSEVLSPPLYRRSAMIVADRVYGRSDDERSYSLGLPRVAIRELSLENVAIAIGPELTVRGGGCVNPRDVDPGGVALYNRMHGASAVHTPPAADRLECVIVGREICSLKAGGETFIPPNGFVLSVPERWRERVETVLAEHGHLVTYSVDTGDGTQAVSAVQVGPQLVRNTARLDLEQRLSAGMEQFAPRRGHADLGGAPPLYHSRERITSAPLARLALGLRPDARCFVVLLEGCESRTAFPEWDSAGGTPAEIADYLVGLGCHDVVELDGGGSAGLFFAGRPIAKGADRNDVPFMAAERAVPGAWCYWPPG